jgi:hypothetical protein
MEDGSQSPSLLGRRARIALVLLGLALVGAAAWAGYFLLLLLLGTSEHAHPAGREEALVWAALLLPLLLLAAAIASFVCRTRRGLRATGAIGAAALADLLVALYFYRLDTMPPPCPPHPAAPAAPAGPASASPIDATGCLAGSAP